MATKNIRIAMDGVTGRLGTNQHLIRSVLAIRQEGGLALRNGDRLVPEPVLLGRNPEKLAALAAAHGGLKWSADTAATLADKSIEVYFDVAATGGRRERALRAIAAGKHIYLEKPIANSADAAMEIVRAAKAAGVKAAAVQDKVFLPGFFKLRKVKESGFFGRILSARLEAQSPATQQVLVDNLSQLKNSLTQQGVAFDRIDVHLAGSQTGSGGAGGGSGTIGFSSSSKDVI